MSKVSKNRKEVLKKSEQFEMVELSAASKAVKSLKTAKFNESVDIAMRLGVDPRHADQMIRGSVVLPNGTGKKVRVAVFAKDLKADEAKKAGADLVGADDLIEIVKGGKIDFDVAIATPDMMPSLAKVARVLGPKGLMPNPKVGTVTPDVTKAVTESKGGKVNFRVDKKGNIHASLGKADFDDKKLTENITEFIRAINKHKPATAKGRYIKSASLSLTMSPSVNLNVQELADCRY